MYTSSKFKLPIRNRNPPPSLSTSHEMVSSENQLGPFSKMMLDSTDIAFRCEINLLLVCYMHAYDVFYRPYAI